jgi:ABC-type hemin transport system ATPase subunit
MSKGSLVADGAPQGVLQADLLTTVYDQTMVVVDHPFRNGPLVLTEPS